MLKSVCCAVTRGAHASSTPLERALLSLRRAKQHYSPAARIEAEERVRVAEESARVAEAALATARADHDALCLSSNIISEFKRSVSALMEDGARSRPFPCMPPIAVPPISAYPHTLPAMSTSCGM